MDYQRSITIDLPYAEAVTRTREALAEQGFGVLSEIDVQATLRDKRGVEMEPYLILRRVQPRPGPPGPAGRPQHRGAAALQRGGERPGTGFDSADP